MIIFNLSPIRIIGATFTLKKGSIGIDTAEGGLEREADRLVEALVKVGSMQKLALADIVIVPYPESSFHTLFLSAWIKKAGRQGNLALHVKTNGCPSTDLGPLTQISQAFPA